MDFKTFVAEGWRDHADDSRGVADRLAHGIALIDADAQIVELCGLANHVFGEHLAAWDEGDSFLQTLGALPVCEADGTGARALRRARAGLALAGDRTGASEMLDALGRSDRIRAHAMAASALAERDAPRARVLFETALEDAVSAALDHDDPANHALAVTGNNLACALETLPRRDAMQRDLMILAAQAGRKYWAIAGGWMEVERAEYRLAMSWLQAGDLAEARQHARACLEIVEANGSAPFERFFGWEAVAQIERAAGNDVSYQQALQSARLACEAIEDEADRQFARTEFARLPGANPG